MAAQIKFHNVTLGYDRHPAVHHLSGEVASGALIAVFGPNGAGKSTLLKGIAGIPAAALRTSRSAASVSAIRLSAAVGRYRPQLSDPGLRSCRMGLWRSAGFFGGMGRREAPKVDRGHRRGRAALASNTAPSARCRAARCSACCSPACCCRTRAIILLDEPFTAIDARPPPTFLAWCSAGTARNAPCSPRCDDLELVRAHFPETLLLARGPSPGARPLRF